MWCAGTAGLGDTEHTGSGMNGVSGARAYGRISSVDVTGGIAVILEPEDTGHSN